MSEITKDKKKEDKKWKIGKKEYVLQFSKFREVLRREEHKNEK
ncbi:MAG: hypothetical protein ACTSYD_12845 [Candidatus Heimdallarchaeaceae archaeon]